LFSRLCRDREEWMKIEWVKTLQKIAILMKLHFS
jgi:hypothetical protein